MRHCVETARAEYGWRRGGRWETLAVEGEEGDWQTIPAGSQEEFITEHYWGYNRQRNGRTLEYQVEHPRWRMRRAREHRFDCDVAGLYGGQFAPFLRAEAASAFLVEGSAISVRKGRAVG